MRSCAAIQHRVRRLPAGFEPPLPAPGGRRHKSTLGFDKTPGQMVLHPLEGKTQPVAFPSLGYAPGARGTRAVGAFSFGLVSGSFGAGYRRLGVSGLRVL